MRGDQLARQWRVIRAIEASPNGLTVAEIAKREDSGIRTIYRDLEAHHSPGHAKARSAPRETFRVLLAFLDIFFPPWHSFRKTIKGFSAKTPLHPLRLGVRKGFFVFSIFGPYPRGSAIMSRDQIVKNEDLPSDYYSFAELLARAEVPR